MKETTANSKQNQSEYNITANKLAKTFLENFSKYQISDPEIIEGMPYVI